MSDIQYPMLPEQSFPSARRAALRALLIETVEQDSPAARPVELPDDSATDLATDFPAAPAHADRPVRRPLRGIARRIPRPRSRKMAIALSAAVAAVLGISGTVAYSQLGRSSVTDHQDARCYTEVVPYSPNIDFPGTTVGNAETGNISSALEVCTALWQTGILQLGQPEVVFRPTQGVYPVPPLVACVMPDGRAAIYPGDPGVCARLGLIPGH